MPLEHQKHCKIESSHKYKPLAELGAVAAGDGSPILSWINFAFWCFCAACRRKQLGKCLSFIVSQACLGGCDHPAPEFRTKAEESLRAGVRAKKLMAHTTSQEKYVPAERRSLTTSKEKNQPGKGPKDPILKKKQPALRTHEPVRENSQP